MRNLFGSLALALSLVVGFAHALAAEPVAGTDYEVLKVAQPTSAPPGKVEVIEFFWYASPQCYKLEPTIEAFVKKERDRILFKRVPVILQERFEPQSKLYYSLVQFGLEEKLMLAVYNEVQKKNGLLSMDDQADFLATQGVDKPKFLEAYYSVSMHAQLRQATKLFEDYHIDAVPTLVVAGKYKTGPIYTKSYDGTATVLDYLVKQVQDKKL
jgi:protein dithiol oxidoreductase (disulfide-forming)